ISLASPNTSTSASATSLAFPTGVWTDGTRLVVADYLDNRVLVWKTFPTTNGQAADFALGQPAGPANPLPKFPNNGGVSGSSMNNPSSIAIDGTALFVADLTNNRVLVWHTFPTAPVAADFALGQPAGGANLTSATTNNGGVTGSSMNGPS